ncbi:hypothetical protein WICPIJ_007473 [Wickerhamomyces pijperi]|uniref:Uncharacterized protein n=1 Tax=Wickerhamomyces pijperi TaxID=599730 RepID=A0A9P8Q2K4_WICPI|nr:hypothetical protein WICPIJ_007473 [Wickerhamomyces pijperi]
MKYTLPLYLRMLNCGESGEMAVRRSLVVVSGCWLDKKISSVFKSMFKEYNFNSSIAKLVFSLNLKLKSF